MKILFMTAECSNDIAYINSHFFEQAVGRIAECKWAGPGHELHVPNENLNDTVKRVLPDADWAIVSDVAQIRFKYPVKIPEKRSYKVAYVGGDVYWDPPLIANRLNAGKHDAFLMPQLKLDTYIPSATDRRPRKADPEFYIKNLNAPIFHLVHNINPEHFKPLDQPKKYEVSFLGAHSFAYYPLRAHIWRDLPELAARHSWRILLKGTPPGVSLKRKIDELLEGGYIVGKRYAEALALSKIFIFGSGPSKCPVKKYFEGMASGACVLADTPMTADELHFKPGYNFVEIKEENWKKRLKYYLKHDEEREKIARRGYETVMKCHTNDVRARQLVDFLEAHK